MRIKKGFVLRQLLGEYVITGEGLERVNFNKIISLNSSAAYLWGKVLDKEFEVQTLADLLMEEYDVDSHIALADSRKLVESWMEAGLLEE